MPEITRDTRSAFRRSLSKEEKSFLLEEIARLTEALEKSERANQELKKQVQTLKEMVELLRRKKYGRSSEKSKGIGDPENLISVKGHQRRPPRDKTISDALPRTEVIIDLPDKEKICPHHNVPLNCIGEDTNEKIEYIPAHIKVIKTIFKKYVCPCCEDGSPVRAPLPPSILPGTMCTPSLLAEIVLKKFEDALPLYRQESIFERVGFFITRATMANWLIKSHGHLMPLYNLLQDRLLEKDYVQMDETRIQVLKEDGKKATSFSTMWVRHTPGEDPITLFDYFPTRSGSVPLELLQGFSGYLQVDGYSGYSQISSRPGITRLACMDHCRRYFWDAYKSSSGKSLGKQALVILKKIYEIERKIKDDPPDTRHRVRQKDSVPLMQEFKDFIDKNSPLVSPKSLSGRALRYAQKEWDGLTVFLSDGRLEMSNIFIENKIRPFALGRKNWLFSSSVEGAMACAFYYSLVGTAKSNSLPLAAYLRFLFERVPLASKVEDYEALLPLYSIQKGNPKLFPGAKTS